MYDRYAGNRKLAERALTRALEREGNTASADVVWVAELDGVVAGAMAAMSFDDWTPRAQRFLRVTLSSIPPWRWPAALSLYRASGRSAPEPRRACFYVDSLATEPAFAAAAWPGPCSTRPRVRPASRARVGGAGHVGRQHRRTRPVSRARLPGGGSQAGRERPAGRPVAGEGRVASTARRASATRSTWPSVSSGKKGSASERARHVLADRELALAVTEALAVEAHQVDRRQVGLRVDPARPQLADRRVAVDPARKLDDVDEPAAAVAVRVRAGQVEPLDARERLRSRSAATRARAASISSRRSSWASPSAQARSESR